MVITGKAGKSKADSEAESSSKTSLTTAEQTKNSGMSAATSVKIETVLLSWKKLEKCAWLKDKNSHHHHRNSMVEGSLRPLDLGLFGWGCSPFVLTIGTATLEISPKSPWIIFLWFGVSAIMVTGFGVALMMAEDSGVAVLMGEDCNVTETA